MMYRRKVTDLETGEVKTVHIGDHLTFSEAANKFGVTRRSFTKVLTDLNLCQREWDEVAGQHRNRLPHEAVEKGLGYRIMGEHGPFDVLSPIALKWIEEDLSAILVAASQDPASQEAFQSLNAFIANRPKGLDVEGKVLWLMDHYPKLPTGRISEGLGVSKSLVHRYKRKREDQLERLIRRLDMSCPFPSTEAEIAHDDGLEGVLRGEVLLKV